MSISQCNCSLEIEEEDAKETFGRELASSARSIQIQLEAKVSNVVDVCVKGDGVVRSTHARPGKTSLSYFHLMSSSSSSSFSSMIFLFFESLS